MQTLADLNRQDGTTVVVSLHQVDFALRFCPRTIALSHGRVVYDGPSSALTVAMLRDLYGAEAEDLLGTTSAMPAHTVAPAPTGSHPLAAFAAAA
jgi:phosphonate transport system ATP-binding protein